jgi:hypothetical protein
MRHLHEAHFADRVVVLVEGDAVDADGDRAAAAMCIGNRSETGMQMQIGAEIRHDGRAGLGDHVEFVRPGMDAMRQCQAVGQQADIFQVAHNAARKGAVGPLPLIDGLEQMHVDAPAGGGGSFGDGFEQRRRAPLDAGRTVLHIDHRTGDGCMNGFDTVEIFGWCRARTNEHVLDRAAIVLGQCGKHVGAVAIDDRILVAYGQREGQPDADIARGLCDCDRLIDDRHLAARAGVMNHRAAAACTRRTGERDSGDEIGIGRRAEGRADDP